MRSVKFCTPHHMLYGNNIRKNEIGEACCAYGERRCVTQRFDGENLRERDSIEALDLDVNGMVILTFWRRNFFF